MGEGSKSSGRKYVIRASLLCDSPDRGTVTVPSLRKGGDNPISASRIGGARGPSPPHQVLSPSLCGTTGGGIELARRTTCEIRPLRIEKKNSLSSLAHQGSRATLSTISSSYLVSEAAGSMPYSGERKKHRGQPPSPGPTPTPPPMDEPQEAERLEETIVGPTPSELGPGIWELIDREEEQQHLRQAGLPASAKSGRSFFSFFRSKKQLQGRQQHQSKMPTIYGRSLLQNLSTVSFSRYRRPGKPSSSAGTPAVNFGPFASTSGLAPPSASQAPFFAKRACASGYVDSQDLPQGLKQIGNGIAFSYPHTPPAATRRSSRMSLGGALTPRGCHNLFGSSTRLATIVRTDEDAAGRRTGERYIRDSTHPFFARELVSMVDTGPSLRTGITNHPDTWTPESFSPTVRSHFRNGAASQDSGSTPASSPETELGPFTPTTIDCEGVIRGHCEHQCTELACGKIDPSATLRLVTRCAS